MPAWRYGTGRGEGETYVEGAEEQSQVEQKHADGIEQIRRLLERVPFNEGAGLPRLEARLEQEEGGDGAEEGDEAEDPHGPAKADARDGVLDDGGQDYAADAGAGGGAGHGEGAPLFKVGAEDLQRRHEHDAEAEADGDALREEEMPVRGAEAGDEGAEDDEERADGEGRPDVARVGETAGDDAHAVRQEELHGSDPRDLPRRQVQRLHVVQLEDPERRRRAPGDGAGQERGQDLEPGDEAAVGRHVNLVVVIVVVIVGPGDMIWQFCVSGPFRRCVVIHVRGRVGIVPCGRLFEYRVRDDGRLLGIGVGVGRHWPLSRGLNAEEWEAKRKYWDGAH